MKKGRGKKPFVPGFHYRKFSWDKESRTLTAEASTLRINLTPPEIQIRGRVNVATFKILRQDRDPDGDLVGTWYENAELSIRVLIIND